MISEIITNTIVPSVLSSCCYDLLKSTGKITLTALKNKFPKLAKNEELAEELADKLKELKGDPESIKDKIEKSKEIHDLLEKINSINYINQTHSGNGDNIAGDKIINYK